MMPRRYVLRLGWGSGRTHPGPLFLKGPASVPYALGYFFAQCWNRIAGPHQDRF